MEMSGSSGIYCELEDDKSGGYQDEPLFEKGQRNIGVLKSSMSVQEKLDKSLDRESHQTDCSVSSGVFSSCTGDLSDLCLADVTNLSDTNSLSQSHFTNKSIPVQRDCTVISTPLVQMRQVSSLCPELSPISSQADTIFSPLFGASDDYLRRNIKFIRKQLNSLMTQLLTEDKYFQSCAERYEEVISDLNNEIAELKNTSNVGEESTPFSVSKNISKKCKNEVATENNIDDENVDGTTSLCIECRSVDDSPKLLQMFNTMKLILPELQEMMLNLGITYTIPELSTRLIPEDSSDFCSVEEFVCMFENCTKILKEIMRFCNETLAVLPNHSQTPIGLESPICVEHEGGHTVANTYKKVHNHSCVDINQQISLNKRDAAQSSNESKSKLFGSSVINDDQVLECKISELSNPNNETSCLPGDNASERLTSLGESEVLRLRSELEVVGNDYRKLINNYKVQELALILENSKLKRELETFHVALDEAQKSSESSLRKFTDLQALYSSLNEQMKLKEGEFCEVEKQNVGLNALLKVKEIVFKRLCSNFNELLAIFRECQNLGLSGDSSESDIDEGFIILKRRLLDLSQDYIALNNKNKVLEKEIIDLSLKITVKEEEEANMRRKLENKCTSLSRTLEKVESERKALIAKIIEQDDDLKTMKQKIVELDLPCVKECQECIHLRDQMRQMKIDFVNKDAAIATLELHIQSCCDYNKRKAQQYKHDLHVFKRQLNTQSTYAADFVLSPKKSKSSVLKVDVGTQAGDSSLHHLTGGFVERFKIGELEEKVAKLEKERIALKRLCKIRSDKIHELESQLEGQSPASYALLQ